MKKADPISTEIIRNAFISIAQDMNAVLIRSAYTPVIYEGKDCVVALLDEKGEVLGQSSGLPLFLGNLQVCVQETAKIYDAVCTPDFFGYNKNLELQYRGRLREIKNLIPVRNGESDLLKAMKQIAENNKGPKKQVPSAGCSIKWKNK